MAEGISIRINSLVGTDLLIPDIKDAGDTAGYGVPGPLYVPAGGNVELPYTSRAATSLEDGSLKERIDAGDVSVDFILAARFLSAVGGGGGATHVADETPSGTIDSANTTFTLASTPTTFMGLYLNGQKLIRGGEDYSIAGDTITMTIAPDPGDSLRADYIV